MGKNEVTEPSEVGDTRVMAMTYINERCVAWSDSWLTGKWMDRQADGWIAEWMNVGTLGTHKQTFQIVRAENRDL